MLRKKATRLKVLRADADLTQIDVARRAGMNVTRYWQIEKGYGNPATKPEREAVAAALSVKVSEIAWPELEVRAS